MMQEHNIIDNIVSPDLAIDSCAIDEHCSGYKQAKLTSFWWYQFKDKIFGNFSIPFKYVDRWFFQVKPGYVWLVDPFKPLEVKDRFALSLPFTKSFVGFQVIIDAKEKSNSQLVYNVLPLFENYSLKIVDAKRRNSIRKGNNLCFVRKIEKDLLGKEVIKEATEVWNSLTVRTSWKTKKSEDFMDYSWKELLDIPGNHIIGCFDKGSGKLIAWLIIKCIDGVLFVDTIASHSGYLEKNPNDILIFAALQNASVRGFKNAHYAMKSYVTSLETFKQSFGFVPTGFPAYVNINFPFNVMMNMFFKKELKRTFRGHLKRKLMSMIKRTFDIALSLSGIILSSPLWLLIAVLILLEDGRPVFFRHERVGKGEKIFKALKFRTMKHSASQPHLDIDIDLKKDVRITRVGKLLRSTAMDELPQLINILKGDMSFVGPRALPMQIDDKITHKYNRLDQIPGYDVRIKVLPGLTGLSQIFDVKSMSLEDKFKRDIEYVNKMNFWLDLKLIFLSFWITLRGAWEKRQNKL